jgi:hypothetical protein
MIVYWFVHEAVIIMHVPISFLLRSFLVSNRLPHDSIVNGREKTAGEGSFNVICYV